jgi:hypothetical protein
LASNATLSAIAGVELRVNAAGAAFRRAANAMRFAQSSRTDLFSGAHVVAFSAMGRVQLRVNAAIAALGRTGTAFE